MLWAGLKSLKQSRSFSCSLKKVSTAQRTKLKTPCWKTGTDSMTLQYVLLLCFGLCVGQSDLSGEGPPSKPRLSVWPSSVVPAGSNVTLPCESPTLNINLIFRKGSIILGSRKTVLEKTAEFNLTNVQQSDAGPYTCEIESEESSDVHFLWVTGHLPKPVFSRLQPDPVTTGMNVTLQCQKQQNYTEYMLSLLKGGTPFPTQNYSSENYKVNFTLLNVTANHTGNYSCVYLQTVAPFWASHPSDPIEILVRDHLPKPVFSRLQLDPVTTGMNVTLQCQKQENYTEYMFSLLKMGTPFPTQNYSSEKYRVTFTLLNVTANHTGNYSCVYRQTEPPFQASDPSDPIEILVKDSQPKNEVTKSPPIEENRHEIIFIAVFGIVIILLLAILIYKYSRWGAALHNRIQRNRSSKDPEVVTGSSVAMKTCSPALDEGPQASRAEQACGVTYTELDVIAKNEEPSSQTKQPDNSCLYAVVKKK